MYSRISSQYSWPCASAGPLSVGTEGWLYYAILYKDLNILGFWYPQGFWNQPSMDIFICISLIANDVENSSLYLLIICVSLVKCLFTSFAHFYIGFLVLVLSWSNFLCILRC